MQKCQNQRTQRRSSASDPVAELAYQFWLERCFRDGSPEEDMFRAVCANTTKAGSLNIRPRLRLPISATAPNVAVPAEF